MGKAKNTKAVKYKGSQILKDARYDHRTARIVLDPEKEYSLKEADALISEYLRKRG